MVGKVISGKEFSELVRSKVLKHVDQLRNEYGIIPGLAVVLVGEDPASKVYVKNKGEQTKAAGMKSVEHKLEESTSCLLYTSPSPRDATLSRMPSSA